MKKLFTFLSRANNNSVGIDSNYCRVSSIYSMLTIVAVLLMVPSGVRAVEGTYDFASASNNSSNSDIAFSTTSNPVEGYSNYYYFTSLGAISDATRFATINSGSWAYKDSSNRPYGGLRNTGGGGRNFMVTQLEKGEVVTFETVSPITLVSSSDVCTDLGNQSYRMKKDGELIVEIPRTKDGIYGQINKITIAYQATQNRYDYDPAIESYDLYWVNKNTTFATGENATSAGFTLNNAGLEATYLSLNSGLALNNRIAISEAQWNGNHFSLTDLWTFSNNDNGGDESQGLKVNYGWHNFSICNLKEGDRVRLTFSGSATFSSIGENGAYNGCSAFKDVNNNGEFYSNEGDREVSCGLSVEGTYNNGNITSYFYTITEDGHLDIALNNGRLCKVEIYGDHQARMVDRDNEFGSKTSYFDTTGQLEAKHHIVPGGLHVYIGNDDANHHAEVVSSDKGPVSYVYDQAHFKMARNKNSQMQYNNSIPVSGTFYKFVPEVTGKMWVKFKAYSIRYTDYWNTPGNGVNQYGTSNEVSTNHKCPYYFTRLNGESLALVEKHEYNNGADGYFGSENGDPASGIGEGKGITVVKGETYYLFGWWNQERDLDSEDTSSGVAELIEVTFLPNQSITPLAKWVDSGTTSDDDLASVTGYSSVVVKKKSDNIASCTAKIEDGKLKISDITFVDKNKGGGTILLKIGDPNNDGDPVFAYTIAYNAGYNQPEGAVRSEGHTWDFSTNPLNGLKWNNKNAEADVTSFGTRFNNFATADKDDNGIPTNGVNNSSLLTEEINKGDWTFNYRVKKNGQFHDPRFLNNYDMEGDNADMMWDTEGLIINAGSTQSCIFNEFGGTVAHTEDDDPDRYVGFLPGSELIIPKLKKNDRVIIYMGSGNGSGQTAMKFNITNALDALHNPISETDEYWAGGSQWNIPTSNVREYHGCYHFFAAADGDMKIKMSSGSMCKLYKIKIYRGDHEETNGIQEKTGGYILLSTYGQGGETKTWSLHYRGKGETLADGNGKFLQENEIIAQTGKISNTTISTNGNDFSYTSAEGDLGTIRVRVKCMEYNHNYVTDYADRNLTLAYHKTMNYPYTWDFMDMDVAEFSGDDIDAEWTRNKGVSDNIKENKPYETASAYNLSMWDADGKMRVNSQVSDPHNFNYIFQNLKDDNGNQLWANDNILPETQGLWFYMDNNDPLYSGCMQIDADGMHLINNASIGGRGWWNYKMVVPSVPAGAAVYLRMARDTRVPEFNENDEIGENNIANSYSYDLDKQTQQWNKNPYKMQKYQFAHMSEKAEIADGTNCRFYQAEDGSDDYIVAIKNTGAESNLTFTLNGWTLKKLSISTDPKKVNVRGWATESRNHVIDPELTAYMTGKDFETCLVTGVDYKKKTITLTRVYPSANNTNYIMTSLADEQTGASIIHNKAAKTLSADDGEVKILDNGFHLFVPDMHDYDRVNVSNSLKTLTDNSSMLVAQVSNTNGEKSIPGSSGNYTNYALTYKYLRSSDGIIADDAELNDGVEAFYRIATNGASSSGNQGYLPLLTNPDNSPAKFSIIFEEEFENINPGITTTIDDIESSGRVVTSEGFYNLNGQKINGIPTQKGMYIVNGKKVLVK